MTIGKVIRLADALKPNAIGLEQKYQYINEVEGMIQSDVMLRRSDDIRVYDMNADNETTELLAKPPHDKIYIAYLSAMIDFANGEYNKYANTIEVFNTYLAEYHRWYFKHFHPADGECEERGYYLKGETPELDVKDGILRCRYGDGEWRELVDLKKLIGGNT